MQCKHLQSCRIIVVGLGEIRGHVFGAPFCPTPLGDLRGDGDQRLHHAAPELRHHLAARLDPRGPGAAQGQHEHEVVLQCRMY